MLSVTERPAAPWRSAAATTRPPRRDRGGGELYQPDTRRGSGGGRRRRLEGEAGLADTADAGQGDHPGVVQGLSQLGQLAVPADEAGELSGQVGRVGVEGSQRWERVLTDLKDPLCRGQIAQSVLAKVLDRDVFGSVAVAAEHRIWPPWPTAINRAARLTVGPK